MIDLELEKLLIREGYFSLREIPNRGIVGLSQFVFTVGIVYGLDATGYKGRYCYSRMKDAIEAFKTWDGVNDPDGPWIKHKGHFEYSNPKLDETIID